MQPDDLARLFPVYFDRILVDAPCSGEGMFRKEPEAVSEWSPENVRMCAERQHEILLKAAEMLKPGGKLHTVEIKDELEERLISFFYRAGISDKVVLHIGDGAEIVKTFDFQFDLAFIDGDKRQYPSYYESVFPKIKTGGYILIDNVLWYDKVLSVPKENDAYTKGITILNDIVQNDDRVENVLLPLRDGLMIVRKVRE